MRPLPLLSTLLAGLVAASAVQAQATKVYQWKDAQGVTHYSDSPPPDSAKARNRRITDSGSSVEDSAEQPAATENPQCVQARSNLAVLAGGTAVQQDTDGDGKPDVTLDDAARANQKALAEAAVKAYCKPAAK